MDDHRARRVDPDELANEIHRLPRPRLLVFDCDGVLAPLVEHADDAVLGPGTGPALAELAATTDTAVAVLSGRSLAGLEDFGFHDRLELVGSYGEERRGRPASRLDDDDRLLLTRLAALADDAATGAGDGAWVEHKPASVVLHVRQADSAAATVALRRARDEAQRLHGVYVHDGKSVVELAVHRSDTGTALQALIDEMRPASAVYVGDDQPDESAFEAIRDAAVPGLAIRVGDDASTRASHLLASTGAVTHLLRALVQLG